MEITLVSSDIENKIKVVGRVDTITAGSFQEQMEKIFDEKPQNLELDCSELSFLSSAGLRALFILSKKVQTAKKTITLKSVNDNVKEVLKISGFISFFKVVD